VAVIGLTFLDPKSTLCDLCWWMLRAAVPVGVLALLLNPQRVSLVRGIGGEVGFDELAKQKRPEA